MQVETTKPWYRQFWPWALISLPATAVVAGLYTYSLAASGSSGLVVDDYYKVGKAINRSLAKGQKAAALGLQGQVAINGDKVRLMLETVPAQELTLRFAHATLPDHDQTVTLQAQEQGIWMGRITPLAQGKWYVDVLPLDEDWRLSGVLPTAAAAALTLQPAR